MVGRRESVGAVVLTHNNINILERLLNSVEWMDEVVVVDSGSTDGTVEQIKKDWPKTKVLCRTLDSFSDQRNYGLANSTSDWIVHMDSDMEVTAPLRASIENLLVNAPEEVGFKLRWREHFHERPLRFAPYPEGGVLRMHRRERGRWVGVVREHLEVDGPIGELPAPMNHYGVRSLSEFVAKLNHYSDLEVLMPDRRVDSSVTIFAAKSIYRTGKKFLREYFRERGYADGFVGFGLCALRAFSVFLIHLKMWEHKGDGKLYGRNGG